MRKHRILTVALVAFAVAALAAAADKPNFSGSWKLDAAKSDFGPTPPPDKMDLKVDHSDPKLKVTQAQSGAQGEDTSEMSFTTDGKEVTNTMRGMDIKGTANWEGDAIVVNNKLDLGGTEIKLKQTYTLSEDKKVLTNNM